MKIDRKVTSKIRFKKTTSRVSFKERKRKKAIGKAILTTIFIILVLSSIYFVVNWTTINISSIEILEETTTPKREIINRANLTLKGSYFYIIPFTNTFFYPRSKLESSITESFLRIKKVKSRRDGFNKIILSVTERKPKYVWCGNEITLIPIEVDKSQDILKESCFFMDNTGLVFAPTLPFSKNIYITYRGSITKNPLGEYYLPQKSFQKIKDVLFYMDKSNIKPLSVNINYAGVGEIETSLGGKIIFSSSELVENSLLEVLDSVFNEPKIMKELTPQEFFSKIEYLDLRLGNKLFYKLR